GWKANGKLVQSEIQSCVWELVSDDKDSGCSAGPGARANRHTGGVRSKNTGLIGAKGAFASHVHDGRRGIGFKSVVDASYRGIPESRKRIAALCVRSHTDRKSTRLNSSHVAISYAVFCLKKKKQRRIGFIQRPSL